uniref:Uncharacterized protein n=1 Tax=Callorhinchus milii TaxID=7868 RepID=A0A4W3GGD0_CALMI
SLYTRLLGPSAAADILQLSSSLPLQSRGRARLLVGNDDVHIIARSDDDLLDDFFHDQTAATSQAGTLSSIPTALTRWTEECKVLDAESMHDCVAGKCRMWGQSIPPSLPRSLSLSHSLRDAAPCDGRCKRVV